MSKYTYKEFIDACNDNDNNGKDNIITILSHDDINCSYSQNGKNRAAPIEDIVNGTCHEYGIVSNPESLKDWNGFAKKSTMI